MSQYLGDISAYALAVSQGYTGTEEEFAELMASYATVGQTAVDAKDAAIVAKTAAETAATTATNKASEATTAAQTATTKAGEASTSASTATSAKDTAVSASQTATSKATEATTAATSANTAKSDAVNAKTAAETAQTAAETAQEAAEDAAESVSASAAQIATNAADISDLKEDLTALEDGETTTIKGYWDESWGGAIGPNIYKSDSLIVPSGKILKNVRIFSNAGDVSGYIYILDANNKILSKIAVTSSASAWTTVPINKTYDVDVYIAVSGASVKNTYSMGEKTVKYSLGLYEGQQTENTKGVGDTLTLAHNVPTRYYSFGVDVSYGTDGIVGQVEDLTAKMDGVDYEINPSDYVMPLVVRKESGYTLIGRWFDRPYSSDLNYTKCCNCGGQSIMFKVKGATSVNVKIEELSRDPSIEDYLMTEVPFLAYSIDGSAFTRVQADYSAGNSITIPDTLEHLVWVVIDGMNMTTKNGVNRESGWCGAYLDSITTDGTTYAVDIKNKQILFVGNSMIEGINTLGTTSTASANSAVSEFSFKTAQKLNAIPLLQGYGGSTVWSGMDWAKQSYTGADNFITTMTPDLIIIEYGHNDNTVINNGTKTVAEFISEYENLIAVLRGQYTGCPIICMIPFKQYLADAIRTVVANTDCCFLIETSSYEVTFSDGTHPNASGATSIAEALSADILKIMGKQFFVA